MSTRVTLTHAGGVVYRRDRGVTTVLLVRARPEPHDWVLPKGHIEPGEQPAATARREVIEEAGVDAAPEQYLDEIGYDARSGERVRVGFFLMRFVRTVAAAEQREIRWCTFEEAAHLVGFDSARRIIESARQAVAGRATPT